MLTFHVGPSLAHIRDFIPVRFSPDRENIPFRAKMHYPEDLSDYHDYYYYLPRGPSGLTVGTSPRGSSELTVGGNTLPRGPSGLTVGTSPRGSSELTVGGNTLPRSPSGLTVGTSPRGSSELTVGGFTLPRGLSD